MHSGPLAANFNALSIFLKIPVLKNDIKMLLKTLTKRDVHTYQVEVSGHAAKLASCLCILTISIALRTVLLTETFCAKINGLDFFFRE